VQAWAELVPRLQPLFASIAYRITSEWGCANAHEIDDIIQDIFLKLGANSGAALGRLPLDDEDRTLACFKVIAANAARDFCKARYAAKRDAGRTVSSESQTELVAAIGAVQGVETQIVLREVNAVLPFDRRERAIFWLYYRQGFTAKEIATMAGVGLTAKGVESMIYRLTRDVRDALGPRAAQIIEKGESASPAS
jgi:RNA polymerase sigma-70 factor (ECF subfamily)